MELRGACVFAVLSLGCVTHGDAQPERPLDALRAATASADIRSAPSTYHFARSGGAFVASNATQGWSLRADAAGVELAAKHFSFGLRLARVGRRAAMRAVDRVAPIADEHRVGFAHDGVLEWYAQGPQGLEQGFDLASRPVGSGPLVLEVSAGGLAPEREDDRTVRFVDAEGEVRLRYGEARAHDARGKPIDVRVTVEEGRVVLLVDDASATFPLHVDPLTWGVEQSKLPTSSFTSVAASGTTIAFGLPSWSGGPTPAVRIWVRNGSSWIEQGSFTGDGNLGAAVSIDGDTAIAGAPTSGSRGAVEVYVRSGTTWSKQATLKAADAADNDHFGRFVALSGDTAVVGAPYKAANTGAAYVFVRSGTAWTQQQKLVASDGASGDFFGRVAVDGNTVVVGAPERFGVAYVFVRSGTTWSEQQKISPSGASVGHKFGTSAAVHGDVAVVGAYRDATTGAAYVFTRSGTTWTQRLRLVASDAAADDAFGSALSMAGDTLVVGAPNKKTSVGSDVGAVYAFVGAGAVWKQEAKLTASDPKAYAAFGTSVAATPSFAVASSTVGTYVFGRVRPIGEACTAPTECASGHCVDGVCCDKPCAGKCEACSAKKNGGKDGTCGFVPDATDPDDDCPGSRCAETTSYEQVCDGKGGCREKSTDCAPFACNSSVTPTACHSTCSDGAHCQAGRTCIEGTCREVRPPKCSDDGQASVDYRDQRTPCAPYSCDGSRGTCRSSCTVSSDCAAGLLCDESKTCAPPPPSVDDGGGCRFGRDGGSFAPLVLGLIALGLARRTFTCRR